MAIDDKIKAQQLHQIRQFFTCPPIPVQTLHSKHIPKDIRLDILRLDQIHPQLSGNKWFKLKYNILEAVAQQKKGLLSFGGVWSNHLYALAWVGHKLQIPTAGIVRGDQIDTATLRDCKTWGMDLHFVDRITYRNKSEPEYLEHIQALFPDFYVVPEGGDNEAGYIGCTEILNLELHTQYDTIASAIGTATTFRGLAHRLPPSTQLWGFPAFRGHDQLLAQLNASISSHNWRIFPEYHQGGFGKIPSSYVQRWRELQRELNIPLDLVYTGKMMLGLLDLIQQQIICSGQKILIVHTGGLQGNRSLSDSSQACYSNPTS